MLRWSIIRTLLYKEVLRYRYNWGLLVMVAALLALSALISISARMKALPGQQENPVTMCTIRYVPGPRAQQWVRHLGAAPAPTEAVLQFREFHLRAELFPIPVDQLVIELIPPDQAASDNGDEVWGARYWYNEQIAGGILPFRDWFARESASFLASKPRLLETMRQTTPEQSGLTVSRVPLIINALVIFALYLLSFNLYVTSTGEEREKRILLGLLLTPASPAEFIVAKAIFYVTASLLVAAAIVCMYLPHLLLNPLLWLALLSGSIGYVAIGTIVVSIVRRQATLNTVSMLYLIATSIIMFLSGFLPGFPWLRRCLIENYLYRQLLWAISETPAINVHFYNMVQLDFRIFNQLVLAVLVVFWSVAAIWIFGRQGLAITRGR